MTPRALPLVVAAVLAFASHAAAQSAVATEGAAGAHADTAPPTETAPRDDWPSRIGPFELGDHAARLRLSAIAQLQLRVDDVDRGDGTRATDAAFVVRRLRPILRGAFADGRIQSVIHLDVAPERLELIDLYVDATILPELRVRVGQLKVPFTQYWQQSLTQLATADWPLTSRVFGGERQIGVMAHDDRTDSEGLRYALGVFAGENRRGAFARELPGIYGESHGNPSSLTAPRAPGPVHPEIVGRVGYASPGPHPDTGMDVTGGDLRYAVTLSAAWDTAPEPRRDFAVRLAPEARIDWAHVSFTTVGYLGFVETTDGTIAPGAVGVLTELGWHAHRHLELALRYSRVDWLDPLVEDARAYARSLEPPDPTTRLSWSDQYGDVGKRRAQHELALGVNVLVIGRSLAWQTDVAWMRTELDDGSRNDLRIRTQLQLAF